MNLMCKKALQKLEKKKKFSWKRKWGFEKEIWWSTYSLSIFSCGQKAFDITFASPNAFFIKKKKKTTLQVI